MSRYSTNPRYPTLSQSLASHQSPASSNSNRGTYVYRPWFSRNRGRRVYPDSRGPSRPNALRTTEYNSERETNPEREFEKSFDKFFGSYCFLQSVSLPFFLILMIFTQIFEDNFEIAVYFCMSPVGLALIYLIHLQMKAKTNRQKRKIGYQILELILILLFLITIRDGTLETDKVPFIVFCSILLANFIGRMINSYVKNFSGLVRFTNQVNMVILAIRGFIFAQGVFTLVQLGLDSPISWFIVFIPVWIIILILLIVAFKLIKTIFFTHRLLFWDSDYADKKKGASWLFGNLFALLSLSIWGFILASFVFDDKESELDKPFLALFIVIAFWCSISLMFGKSVKDYAYKVCKELATISNTDEKVIMEMIGIIREKKKESVEEEKKRQEQLITYVIKVSSSYFKPATEQEIKLLNSQVKPIQTPGEGEIEADTQNQQGENTKCIICFSNIPDAVLMECGHGGTCFECAQEINNVHQECHMCRQKIKRLFKINMKNNKKNFYKIINEIKNKDIES